ncbi:enoyl-CoA delta isomerase 1, mitochondrial-like [Patiria miniata]|uniref:Enoyl-CoA delta isomerase 1, mitochondrial n=1 Tax=Patiria miniata TaxID=46514 RepID=A0A914ALG1_PATMI|nr:enoyl-CoA delta isomerase 1, mitochondrial-like [Patiria miniata]
MATQEIEKRGETGNNVEVERDSVHKEIAIVKMNRATGNKLSTDFMTELNTTLEKLENDDSCRGIILTSAIAGIFSLGLDGTEMYQKSLESTSAFWRSLQDFWMRLYGSKLATVAAINGHSPATGCQMAMSCDYRVMSEGPFGIGLPEVTVGLVAPFWFQEVMVKTCGERQTEMAVGLGTMFTPEEALKIGLVDEVVRPGDLISKAREQLLKWLKNPDRPRAMTKDMRRGPLLEKLRAQQEEDIATFNEYIHEKSVQESFGMSLESRKK